MGLILFLLFLFVPLIEIAGFILIGGAIGLWPTLAIVILTAIAGSILLHHQGLSVIMQAQTELGEGKIPYTSVIDGVWLAIAGALLLTPGFFTDIFGFLLFIPPIRRTFGTKIFQSLMAKGSIHVFGDDVQPDVSSHRDFFQDEPPSQHSPDGPIIDGEFESVDPDETYHSNNGNPPHSKNPENPKSRGNKNSPWSGK